MKPTKGIVVDGACSGNPGPGEYRAVDLETGKELFRQKFKSTTNNIMEFCGIVHALKWRKENSSDLQIYSDSVIGIAWVEKKKANSSLPMNESTGVMYTFIRNCEMWLLNNTKNNLPVNKWVTKEWGEIPADFGNKSKGSTPVAFPRDSVEKEALENFIEKKKLEEWIKREWVMEFADITTLSKLKRDFNINITQ